MLKLNLKKNETRFKNVENDLLALFFSSATSKSNKTFRFAKVDNNLTAFLPYLTDGAVKLYLYYALAANNDTGESWHSIDKISQKLGTTERSISNWNHQLEDLGLIYRTSTGKKSKATFVLPLTGFALKMSIQQIEQAIRELDLYHAGVYTKIFGKVQSLTKLYIKGDLTVGHCFVCTRNYVNVTDRIDTTIKFPEFISRFINFSGMPEIVKLTDPDWSIDNIEQDLVDYDKKGVDYLIGRHPLMEELYKVLDFKFLDGNVVMPFKYHGEVFYYQIRFTEGKIRYFFPPISAKPPYIIEHGDNSRFIICEGVFDAISLLIQAPDYTPCAVLGSSVSDYQIEFIREYAPKEILIYMDETDISKRIASKLSKSIDYCPINIIPSNGEDPEECMIRKMKEGKELSWIKPQENLGRKNLSWEYKNPMIR